MSTMLNRAKSALAVLLIAAAPAGAAFAGEGGGPAFPGEVQNVAGSQQSADLPAPTHAAGVVLGSTLPPVSNGQGEPEPINSLPPGFEDGTPAMQHRQALRSHWAAQAQQPG